MGVLLAEEEWACTQARGGGWGWGCKRGYLCLRAARGNVAHRRWYQHPFVFGRPRSPLGPVFHSVTVYGSNGVGASSRYKAGYSAERSVRRSLSGSSSRVPASLIVLCRPAALSAASAACWADCWRLEERRQKDRDTPRLDWSETTV